jgi:hypothetical protein|nr:MAG TPA: hypothetical protein [Caudoviricetes sp.]DAH62460.1 MAG TPA: hypothetical protein [Caudoviricetes sp.]
MFETNLSSNIDPHILRQMSENYQNNQLKNEIAQTNNAEYMAKVIGQRIVDFQSTLSEVQDVALQIIQFNNSITLYVTKVSHLGLGLIVFQGSDSANNPCEIVQHISQINVLMAIVSKPADIPHRKIGF